MRVMVSMLCWICLCLWLAAALTAGGSAIGVFATMPDLHVTLAEYEHLPADDQTRLAAGLITEPIFAATDVLQILLSSMMLIGVALHWCMRMGCHRPLARGIWTSSILIAIAMLWWRVVMIMPSMNHDLRTYRDASAHGEHEAADLAKTAFDAMHPVASAMMEIGAGLLVLAIFAGAALCVPRRKQATP